MGKCREEFELFWTARCCVIGIECVLTRLINGDYYDIKAYYAWIGWSERQKSMKPIRFPSEIDIDLIGDQVANSHANSYTEGYNDAISDLELKITELSYKVEE